LNPCIAHCSTDSIPWVHHSREEKSLDYDRGFVRLQIHMNFDTIIYRQQDSTFQQGSTPRRSPLPPPPPTMNSPGRWGGEPLLLTPPVLLILLLSAFPPPDPPLHPARYPLLFTPLCSMGGRPRPGCRWIRSCDVHSHPLLKDSYQDHTGASRENEERMEAYSPPGHRGA
jgi:hypothetical protein